jgi:hypothetical protein
MQWLFEGPVREEDRVVCSESMVKRMVTVDKVVGWRYRSNEADKRSLKLEISQVDSRPR